MNNTTINVLKNLVKSYMPLEKKLMLLKAKKAKMVEKIDSEIANIEENIAILDNTSKALSGGYDIKQFMNLEYLNTEDEEYEDKTVQDNFVFTTVLDSKPEEA